MTQLYPIQTHYDRETSDRVRRLNLTGKLFSHLDLFDLAMANIDAAFKAAFPVRKEKL